MYRQISTGNYPFSTRDIKRLFPNTSFPKPFRADDFEFVFGTPKPSASSLKMVREITPIKDALDKWSQAWEIVDKFSDYTDEDDVVVTKAEQETAFTAQEFAKAKAELLDKLNQKANEVEAQGIEVNGTAIKTDEKTIARLSQAAQQAASDTTITLDWKLGNGNFAVFNASLVNSFFAAVTAHVQAVFTRERVITTAINNCTTKAQIDSVDINTGW